jgi:hypothetical protein
MRAVPRFSMQQAKNSCMRVCVVHDVRALQQQA